MTSLIAACLYGVVVHIAFHGWRQAPANVIVPTWRQRVIAGLVVGVPLSVVLVASFDRGASTIVMVAGDDGSKQLVLACLFSTVTALIAIAPRLQEDSEASGEEA